MALGSSPYIVGLLVKNILSIPLATETIPDACPENSEIAIYRKINLNVSDEELHQR